MVTYQNRSEVPEKYKWDLTSFFTDEEDYQKNFKCAKEKIHNLEKYKGCTKNPQKLFEFLESEIATIALCEDLYVYSFLINDQELGVSKSIERMNEASNLYGTLDVTLSFFAPELLKLSQDEYEKLFKDNAKLLEYKALLDDIYREKDHILNEQEESIISTLVNSMNHYEEISSTMLNKEHNYGKIKINEEEITISSTNYRKLMKNEDKKIRQKVYNSYQKVLSNYADTSASLLNSYVNMCQKLALLHHYESSWEEKLFDLKLSNKVFQTLVTTVEKNLSVLHDFYKLKAQVLQTKKLKMSDLFLNMTNNSKEYTIEDAQDIIRKSLKPLGSDYLSKYEKIITNHYIDYCQYKGKCSGGYSCNTMRQDSRILLSFNGELDSVSTIAHEAGHNVHSQYLKENNPIYYANAPHVVCEVASLTNEFLLSYYIEKNSHNKNERLNGIENILNVMISNLFGAVREGVLEQHMYDTVKNEKTITKEYLNNLALKSLKKYYGPSVVTDKYAQNNWITRSHYYMNFYLYSYAICVTAASNLALEIFNGNKEVTNKYIEFLKTGSSKDPMEIFNILGINLEDEKFYETAINNFASLVKKYKEIFEGDEDE